jgi:polysaccharide biosynthesis/export protein
MDMIRTPLFAGCVFLVAICASYAGEAPQSNSALQNETQASTPRAAVLEDSQRPALQHRNPRYQLCKDDVLELNFPKTPEFNQTVVVQPDGYVTLVAVGDIHVEGETLPEVTTAIRSAYAKTLYEAIVTVRLKEFDRPYFVVDGQVGRPGKYDLRGDTTVLQAIAIGGGLTDGAKHSQVWLFRKISNDWMETRRLDVKKMLSAGNLSEDLHLRPGDMVYVPKNTISKIKPFIPVATVGTYVSPH